MLVQFRNSPQNCYHLEQVELTYTLQILSCKSLGVAMVVKNQEKEILTSEEIGKLETMNIIHVEVKCSMDRAARLIATCK